MNATKLDIGCGENPREGFKGVDRRFGAEAYPLEGIADDSVAEIYASHVLEHFPHAGVAKVLAEWIRVLEPGGRIRVAVPDFAWIAREYLTANGNLGADRRRLFGYAYGGQTDANDFHESGFDEHSLRNLMRTLGLRRVRRWEPDSQDCASLPVSLNLEGIKAAPIEIPTTAAVMSLPRLAHTANWFCAQQVLVPRAIDLMKVTGAFWGQCLERGMEQLGEDGAEWVLTMDYDTVFTGPILDELCAVLATNPELDAVAPWQVKRESSEVIAWFTDDTGRRRTTLSSEELDREWLEVDTAHFGLTLFRVSSLSDLPHPWFKAEPNADGRWGEHRVDEDIRFWHHFKEHGRRVAIAPHVAIGHIQQMITWPDEQLRPIHQHIDAFQAAGPPENARTI